MMYQKIQSLIERGSVSQIVYVNFEDERLLEITSDDLNIILEIGIELSGTANRPYLFLMKFKILTDGKSLSAEWQI